MYLHEIHRYDIYVNLFNILEYYLEKAQLFCFPLNLISKFHYHNSAKQGENEKNLFTAGA